MRLWTAAQPAVASFVDALVRDRAAADDVVQDTSLVLDRRFEEYSETAGPFVAWALGIARFQVLGLQRGQARSRVAFDEELLARFTESWAQRSPRFSDRTLALQECLGTQTRRLVRVRYFDDMTAEKIAQALDRRGDACDMTADLSATPGMHRNRLKSALRKSSLDTLISN